MTDWEHSPSSPFLQDPQKYMTPPYAHTQQIQNIIAGKQKVAHFEYGKMLTDWRKKTTAPNYRSTLFSEHGIWPFKKNDLLMTF